jgi:CRISPR-associated protein Csh1
MIQEIINLVDTLPSEVFTDNIQLKEGLYILLDINEEGDLINVDSEGKVLDNDIGFYSKKDEQLSEAVSKSLSLWTSVVPISTAKIFNPIKKIFGNT